MGEVEAEPVGAHQRAGLLDVVAEHLLQGRLEEVGGGMVARRGVRFSTATFRSAASPTLSVPSLTRARWTMRSGRGRSVSTHLQVGAAGGDVAGVARLAADLAVEGGSFR